MTARPYNAVHLAVLEARGISSKALFIEACCNLDVIKVTELENGRIKSKQPVTIVGCEFAPGILLHVKDNGKIITSILGSVALHFDAFDFDGTERYKRWIAVLDEKALCVGHLLIELIADTSYQLNFKVNRVENPSKRWRFCLIRLNLREKEFKTKNVSGDDQVWNETFKISVSRNESLVLSHLSDEILLHDTMGQTTLTLDDLLSEVGLEKKIELSGDGERSGTLVYTVTYDVVSQAIPIRVVRGINLAKTDLDMAGDPYTILKLGNQEFRTNIREGSDPEWENEFLCTVEPQMTVELIVKDDDVTFDDLIGSASMTGREIIEKKGTTITVPLRGSKNISAGSIVVAIGVPFGYELNQKYRNVKPTTVISDFVSGSGSGSKIGGGGSVYSQYEDNEPTFTYRPSDRNTTGATGATGGSTYQSSSSYVRPSSPVYRSTSPTYTSNYGSVKKPEVIEAPPSRLGISSADERYAAYRRGDSASYSANTYVPISMGYTNDRVSSVPVYPSARYTVL